MRTKSSIKRSLVKTITYRAAIVIANGVIVFALTGRLDTAFGFSIATIFLNSLMYFANERLWNNISWGQNVVS